MVSLRDAVFPFSCNLKKIESDGTAGGVLGEECRAVLRFVFGAGVSVKSIHMLKYFLMAVYVTLFFILILIDFNKSPCSIHFISQS